MTRHDVTVSLPEELYVRLQRVAAGTQQSFADVLLRTIQIGCPPSWEDVPAEFQMDLAAMDRLSDDHLWEIAHSRQSAEEMERYATLLEKHANDKLSATEKVELASLRAASDKLMLDKAHAAALLRWRGHQLPPPEAI